MRSAVICSSITAPEALAAAYLARWSCVIGESLGFRALRLYVDDFLDTIFRENVMIAANPLLKA